MSKPIWFPYEQGSVGWLKERCGCLTASRMAEAMDFTKKGESAARKKLKIEIIAERMTDSMADHYVSPAMEWGIQQEPHARSRYEEITGTLVQLCGFALHESIPFFGASPDGLIGDDGLIEIKCPTTVTYVDWMTAGCVPEQHKAQMAAQLAVTGRRYVDFFAFDPRIKVESHQHFLRRFEPKPEEIAAVEEAAKVFLAECEILFSQVTEAG